MAGRQKTERVYVKVNSDLILDKEEAIGTVTIKENEICRLFVLPKYQHKGFGRQLLL